MRYFCVCLCSATTDGERNERKMGGSVGENICTVAGECFGAILARCSKYCACSQQSIAVHPLTTELS